MLVEARQEATPAEKGPAGDDPVADPTKDVVVPADKGEGDDPKPEKTYTQSELDSILDKRLAREKREAAATLAEAESEAEKKRLSEKGQHEELGDLLRAENDTLKADKARAEFVEESRAALKELGLSIFEDVLLQDVSSIDGLKARAAELSVTFDAEVERRVNERLGTGTVPKGDGTPIPTTVVPSKMKQADKLKFIKEHGRVKYQELVEAESAANK